MTDTPDALPPLPEPLVYTHLLEVNWALKNAGRAGSFYATPESPNDLKLFTADQMRAYARAALAQRQQVPEGWSGADADAARLALELECMLTDKDVPTSTVSRWWDSAHEALDLHRKRLAAAPALTAAPSAQEKP